MPLKLSKIFFPFLKKYFATSFTQEILTLFYKTIKRTPIPFPIKVYIFINSSCQRTNFARNTNCKFSTSNVKLLGKFYVQQTPPAPISLLSLFILPTHATYWCFYQSSFLCKFPSW